MKTTLFLGLLLFLSACSDSTSDKQATQAPASSKEAAATMESPAAAQPSAKPAQTASEANETESAGTAAQPRSGHLVFAQKCASCHGKQGEKAALNKSQIIAGWEKERTLSALKGYKDGSYGSSLKGIMKGQVGGLNDQQLQAVSEYISTL